MPRQEAQHRLAIFVRWMIFIAAVFTLGLVPTRRP